MTDQHDLDTLIGTTVFDQDGDKVGSIGQVYLDDRTEEPKFVTVNTGLFGSHETFVPYSAAERSDKGLRVPFEKSYIKDAPSIGSEGHLSPEDERRLFEYYQVDYNDAGGDAGRRDHDDRRGDHDHAGRDAAAGTAGAAGVGAAGAAGAADGRRDGADHRDAAHDAKRAVDPRDDRRGAEGADSVVAHEERLNVGTETHEAGRARLRKRVVTEHQSVDVPVQREELVVEREKIDPNSPEARGGHIDRDGEVDETITLREERPVVDKETVATERVNVGTRTVQDTETVSGEVRKEQIEVDGAERGADGRGVDGRGADGRDVDPRDVDGAPRH